MCRKHGGGAPQVQAVAQARTTIADFPVDAYLALSPWEAVRQTTARALQIADALRHHFADKAFEEWTTTKQLPGGGSEPIIDPLVRLWNDAASEARKAAADLAKINIDALALQLEVARSGVLVAALDAAFTAAEIPPDRAVIAFRAFRAHLEEARAGRP